jgi:O-antigen ligase
MVAASDALLGGHLGPDLTGVIWNARYAGFTTHPNTLGLVCAMAFPTAIVMAASGRRMSWRVVYAVAGLILPVGVLVSGSRAGLLGIVAGVVALALIAVPTVSKRRIVAVSCLGVVGLFVLAALQGSQSAIATIAIDRLTGQINVGYSDAGHLQNLSSAWDGFLSSPIFGTGFSSLREANNLFLQTLEAGGIIALAGFIGLVVGAIHQGLRLARSLPPGDEASPLLCGAVAGMAAWLVDGLFQNAIADRYLYIPFALILGLGLGCGLMARSASTSAEAWHGMPLASGKPV